MRLRVIVALVCVAVFVTLATSSADNLRRVSLADALGEKPVHGLAGTLEQDAELFKAYTLRFSRAYSTPEEYGARFENFRTALRRADKLNEQQMIAGGEPVYGITKFSDWSENELARLRMSPESARQLTQHHRALQQSSSDVPDNMSKLMAAPPVNLDWRKSGAVGPVRNQGQCGSCWAFSTAQTVESFWFLAGKGPLNPLSVQQLVSCDTSDDNCHGGFPLSGYKYISNVGGLASERSYPYVSGTGDVPQCRFNKTMVEASISGSAWAATNGNEKDLINALVNQGPLSICIDAHNWASYKSGVIMSCGTWIDHCVQLVGYANYTAVDSFTPSLHSFAATNSTGYYIVRNSWDTDWGQDGYIYLAMGKNMCAIADRATYVRI